MSELHRRLPPLATLVAFEAAFRHRSFTRAADELALSQASISRRVHELENHLGVRLFERRRYDVAPTVDGETLALTVQTSLRELATTSDRLRDRGAGRRRFTVYSNISLAQACVAPVIGEFQAKYTDLHIQVLASSEPIEVVRDDFDIGLQLGRWAEDKFEITPIGDDSLFPVCSPGLAAQLPTPVTPAEVSAHPLLHFAEPGRTWPDWRTYLANFRVQEPAQIEGLTFNSYQICLDVAEKGGGIALGWAHTVKSRLDSGRLVRIPGMAISLPNIINVYRRKQAAPNPIAERFIKILRKRLDTENIE